MSEQPPHLHERHRKRGAQPLMSEQPCSTSGTGRRAQRCGRSRGSAFAICRCVADCNGQRTAARLFRRKIGLFDVRGLSGAVDDVVDARARSRHGRARPSTSTSNTAAVCTTAFVIATFSSYGRAEPSTMTDGKPALMPRTAISYDAEWSRCTAIGTSAFLGESFANAATWCRLM